MNSTLLKLGRFLYAIPIAVFGILHFMNAGSMAGMVPAFIPGGVFWVYLTGLALIAAAVSFMIQKKVRLAGILLGIMLIIFVLTIHLPGVAGAEDAQSMQMSMSSLLKDLGLAAAAFYIAGSYSNDDVMAGG